MVYENPMQKHAKDIKFNHGSVILPKIWSSKHSIGWKLASLITYMGLLNGSKGILDPEVEFENHYGKNKVKEI